jgi:hypothetical protein
MTAVLTSLVMLWRCAAVSDLGGDLVRLLLEQPSVKFDRDVFGQLEIRDHADAIYWVTGERVMMRYYDAQADTVCLRQLEGPHAERIKLMLEAR